MKSLFLFLMIAFSSFFFSCKEKKQLNPKLTFGIRILDRDSAKCKILKIGKIKFVKEGQFIITGWEFDCTNSIAYLLSMDDIDTMKISGWTLAELRKIADTYKLDILYGTVGVYQPIDSQKIYFKKFLYFQNKMNKSTGRAFARYEDSCTKYYKLLYKK